MRCLAVAAWFLTCAVGCSFSTSGVGPGEHPDGATGDDGPVSTNDGATPGPDAGPMCPGQGMPCDGPDTDLCPEGVIICDGANPICTDTTDNLVELCNGVDDDCDGTIDNGFDLQHDPTNCGSCGTTCTNAHGTTGCMTSACAPVCASGYQSCDGDLANGCELLVDTNPMCSTFVPPTSFVNGDSSSASLTASGHVEAWYAVNVRESLLSSSAPLTARITLDNPPGVDYDLYVYCVNCGMLAASSLQGPGVQESVDIGRDDNFGDVSFPIMIEVRYYDDTDNCAGWTLTVTGNVTTDVRNCN